ncbi:C6 zinc finger domain protein [Metarhizium anisopliae]
MVGVPRSTGCQLCRRRRVKCDEVRPECGNCRKYGADCPGYERGIKFVSGKHAIRPRTKTGNREGRELSKEASPFSAAASRASASRSSRASSPTSESTISTLSRSPCPNRAEFVSTIVASVKADISKADISGFLSWCDMDKLGVKAVLDGAMCSLALHLVGKENEDESMVAHSRTIYGHSLGQLQMSLRHEAEWKTSETLCAAMLLCIFELFAGTNSSDSWLLHARGIGTLIEQRGPNAHSEGWDASMILAFRGVLIMCDMFFPSGEGCFLSRPEWKPVVRDGGRHLIHPATHLVRTIHVIDEFFERLAEIPSVLAPTFVLRESKTMGTFQQPDDVEIAALALRSIEYRRLFNAWYDKFTTIAPLPYDIPSQDPDSPFDFVLQYNMSWMGSMYIGYWACLLILQEALVQCEWPEEFEQSRGELVRNILRSIETVGAGTMGPYRVGFGIRIAYELASTELQLWVRRVLDRFKKTYAATDKSTYPAPRTDDGGYS